MKRLNGVGADVLLLRQHKKNTNKTIQVEIRMKEEAVERARRFTPNDASARNSMAAFENDEEVLF